MTMTEEPITTSDGETDHGPRTWSAAGVIVAVAVGLAVGALLNAESLVATAERQPFGWQREVAVSLARPVSALSSSLGLDRPRHGIDVALGRRDPAEPAVDAEERPAAPGPEEEEMVVAAPSEAPPPRPTAAPSPTQPDGPMGLDRGPVTAADPVRLYIAGDSMVEIQFGTAVQDLADDTGMIETLAIDFDRGSGLSRPDFVDWPARLANVSAEHDPDVMLLYFGGNDAQPLKIDDVVYEPADAEWQDEYRARVADLMDQLVTAGHHVYWMGLPIPRDQSMVVKFGILNGIYSSEAQRHDGVTYVDVWDLFAGPDGTFSEYLPDEDGGEQDMRLDDGIHLTTAGAYRAARPTVARIVEDFDIQPISNQDG